MNTIATYRNFSGNATELSLAAVNCSKQMGWPVDPEKTNERLVRYYVTEGVLDKPDRQGRDATYTLRHLLQLLNARRMVDKGLSLSVISEYNRNAISSALEEGLSKPVPTEAELLVSTFKKPSLEQRPSTARSLPRMPPLAIPDVLDDVKRLKDDWMKEIEFVKRLRDDFDRLRHEIAQNREMIDRTNDRFNITLEKMAAVSMEREASFMKRLSQMLESQGYEVKASNKDLGHEIHELRHVFLSELDVFKHHQKTLLESLEVMEKRLAHIKFS